MEYGYRNEYDLDPKLGCKLLTKFIRLNRGNNWLFYKLGLGFDYSLLGIK